MKNTVAINIPDVPEKTHAEAKQAAAHARKSLKAWIIAAMERAIDSEKHYGK